LEYKLEHSCSVPLYVTLRTIDQLQHRNLCFNLYGYYRLNEQFNGYA